MVRHILSIDQGTSSSRAIVFDESGNPIASSQKEFRQIYPNKGWVEHDPEEIWKTVSAVCKSSITKSKKVISCIGITNQRETTIVWDRKTGKPIYNAIVWQDRRTADYCRKLKESGKERDIRSKTGLLLDPYFSATKLKWILDNVSGARRKAEDGKLAFGTIDSFLLWRLTDGKVHATDATNASRTMLYNIHEGKWDSALLKLFDIPREVLPEVMDCAADFGTTTLFGKAIPITGIAGDQHAATIGQACFSPGMIKSTYGTGCFVMVNTGNSPVSSSHRLLTTIAYKLNGKTTYATEGSIFVAGAAVQWLRDSIKIIKSAKETEELAASCEGNSGVYVVPAFTGLGAPYWEPDVKGSIFGLTRDTNIAQICRATLESIAYQTNDLIDAIRKDGISPKQIRVDGGMVNNAWLMQFLADILDIRIDRPRLSETTALGAAYLAGLQHGIYKSTKDIAKLWKGHGVYQPKISNKKRDELLKNWQLAVDCARKFSSCP